MTRQSRTTAGRSAGEAGSRASGESEASEDRSRRADSARRRRTAADPAADYWERLRSMRHDSPADDARRPGDAGRGSVDEPRSGGDPDGERPPAGGEPPAGDAARDWERIRDARWFGGEPGGAPANRPPSLSSLLMLLEAVRSVVPRELEQQFNALLREALLTLRALIDWYLERLDGGRREQRVEDIPIE